MHKRFKFSVQRPFQMQHLYRLPGPGLQVAKDLDGNGRYRLRPPVRTAHFRGKKAAQFRAKKLVLFLNRLTTGNTIEQLRPKTGQRQQMQLIVTGDQHHIIMHRHPTQRLRQQLVNVRMSILIHCKTIQQFHHIRCIRCPYQIFTQRQIRLDHFCLGEDIHFPPFGKKAVGAHEQLHMTRFTALRFACPFGDGPNLAEIACKQRQEPVGFTKISALGVEEQRVLIISDITSDPEQWQTLGDGYRVESRFILWEEPNVLQIPASALFRSGDQWAIFVVQDNKARRHLVKVGQRNGLSAQILSGLTEGAAVITHPNNTIEDGVRVRQR